MYKYYIFQDAAGHVTHAGKVPEIHWELVQPPDGSTKAEVDYEVFLHHEDSLRVTSQEASIPAAKPLPGVGDRELTRLREAVESFKTSVDKLREEVFILRHELSQYNANLRSKTASDTPPPC